MARKFSVGDLVYHKTNKKIKMTIAEFAMKSVGPFMGMKAPTGKVLCKWIDANGKEQSGVFHYTELEFAD